MRRTTLTLSLLLACGGACAQQAATENCVAQSPEDVQAGDAVVSQGAASDCLADDGVSTPSQSLSPTNDALPMAASSEAGDVAVGTSAVDAASVVSTTDAASEVVDAAGTAVSTDAGVAVEAANAAGVVDVTDTVIATEAVGAASAAGAGDMAVATDVVNASGVVPVLPDAASTPAPAVNTEAYTPETPYDNSPWRFDMSQGGKRMTADAFAAWMKARGVRIAKGAPQPKATTTKLPVTRSPHARQNPTTDGMPAQGAAAPIARIGNNEMHALPLPPAPVEPVAAPVHATATPSATSLTPPPTVEPLQSTTESVQSSPLPAAVEPLPVEHAPAAPTMPEGTKAEGEEHKSEQPLPPTSP